MFAAVRILGELLSALRPIGDGVYKLDRVYLMPKAREAFADAAIYLGDERGDVWN
jgi:hypothetical protein